MIKMMEFFFIMKWDFLTMQNIASKLSSSRLAGGEETQKAISIKCRKRIECQRCSHFNKDDGL